jgi:hypothetical protein
MIHRVKAMRVEQKELLGMAGAIFTRLIATHDNGSETEITMFHGTEPVQIEGADHVNFVAESV